MTHYMRAIELERRLAEAMGHKIAFVAEASGTVWVHADGGGKNWMPAYARDVSDNMSLMLEVGVWPRETTDVTLAPVFEIATTDGWICHREPIPADGHRKAVLLLAVVAGAIAALEQRTAAEKAIRA